MLSNMCVLVDAIFFPTWDLSVSTNCYFNYKNQQISSSCNSFTNYNIFIYQYFLPFSVYSFPEPYVLFMVVSSGTDSVWAPLPHMPDPIQFNIYWNQFITPQKHESHMEDRKFEFWNQTKSRQVINYFKTIV